MQEQLNDIYHSFNNKNVNVSTDAGYYMLINFLVEKKCLTKNVSNFFDDKKEPFSEENYKLEKGEKVVYLWKNKSKKLLFLTNFSRVFFVTKYNLKFHNFNFWLSQDDILILNSIKINNPDFIFYTLKMLENLSLENNFLKKEIKRKDIIIGNFEFEQSKNDY